MQLDIQVSSEGGYSVVSPRGEVDLATHQQLKNAIDELLADGSVHLVVDLSNVDFIDSTGLGALIGGRRKANEAGGSFCVVTARERFLKLFRITGLDSVFEVYAARTEAVARPVVAHVEQADA
jgi:anti-sigma B factor antagonist